MTELQESGGRPGTRRESPYQRWQKAEAIPIYKGSYISDLYHLEVSPWPRMGQKGALVNLADQEQDDAWVVEIGPGGQTAVQHHLFEATVYVLDGRGATTFWQEGARKHSVEWQRGSIFSPPLNCHYQHFNGDGQQPARLFAVTNAPMLMNLFRNPDFLFGDTYAFTDRYNVEDTYFTRPGQRINSNAWKLNFIPDIRTFALDDRPERGAGGQLTTFSLSNNSMAIHCSQFPPGTYKKAHQHNVGAHVVILDGEGYSLLWFEGQEPQRVDWKDGSVLSPKEGEYHQHFNAGETPARYLALRLGDLDARHWEGFMPQQIEYEDEDPATYRMYEQECAKVGATVVLPQPAYRNR